jgi:FAD/FMN-containing dehydrogenase
MRRAVRRQPLDGDMNGAAATATPPVLRQTVASWGRIAPQVHEIVALRNRGDVPAELSALSGGRTGIAHGNGRSYGDIGLNPGGTLWTTRGLDRFIDFDPETGILGCEAGVLLKDIIDAVLPRGWFLPVTPGTQLATLGGAIANDVHGKNHHRAGTLGEHIESLELCRTDGSRLLCSGTSEPGWLEATIGGMGLTGVIASARLRLKRVRGPWIDTEAIAFHSLAEFLHLSASSEAGWEYTVSWIDCLRSSAHRMRGIFFRGNHADDAAPAPVHRMRELPFAPPFSLVNGLTLRLFNALYYRVAEAQRGRPRRMHYARFFHPLDRVSGWNRIYGPSGFYQYQCVVPRSVEEQATAELLSAIAASGSGSFLAVLKTFGTRASAGLMSFPLPGTTLALDFPNRGEETLRLFERLDAIVLEAHGRVYPAKDACMTRQLFERGYPRLDEFLRFRDPLISSAMSRRLLGS